MNETNTRKNSRRSQIRVHRLILLFISVVLLAGLILGIAALARSCRASSSRRDLPFSSEDGYYYTGDGFLYSRERKINYLDLFDESKSFSLDADADGAGVIGTGSIKAVYGTSSLHIIGTPYEHTVEGVIRKIVCGGKYVGIYTENADNSHSLIVYNSAGTQCYKNDLGSTVLLDFGFEGGSSSSMYMCELVTTGSAVSTTVTTFDIARESITGVMNVQGEAVKNVFITKKSVFVFGTDSFIRYDRATNSEAYRLLCRGYECEDSYSGGGIFQLLLSKSAEPSAPMRVLQVKEEASSEESVLALSASNEAKRCLLMRGKIVEVGASNLTIRSIKGDVTATLPLGMNADDAIKLDDSGILIIEGTSAIMLNLKNF